MTRRYCSALDTLGSYNLGLDQKHVHTHTREWKHIHTQGQQTEKYVRAVGVGAGGRGKPEIGSAVETMQDQRNSTDELRWSEVTWGSSLSLSLSHRHVHSHIFYYIFSSLCFIIISHVYNGEGGGVILVVDYERTVLSFILDSSIWSKSLACIYTQTHRSLHRRNTTLHVTTNEYKSPRTN